MDDFFRDLEVRNRRHAVLTCFGCAGPVLSAGYRLIEDDVRFARLLNSIASLRTRPRSFRPCYLGLLHAYFGYDGDTAASSSGRESWRQLRSFLRDSMQDLATTGLQPAWAEALNANPQLLGEDPGRFYGASALERGQEEFEQLRRTLDIRRNSWLVWRLVLGEIHAATDKADEPFLGLVPRLLDLLVKTPPAVNTGLSRLLDRYCERRNVSVHEGLRDYAVAQWGNPWLDVNRAKWSCQ